MLVANFKSNKNSREVLAWIEAVGTALQEQNATEPIVVCPQFPSIALAKQMIDENKWSPFIKLGAQDISPFGAGAYTGAVSAEALVGLVDYVLIGHSERRQYFKETTEEIAKKVFAAKEQNITPILCVSDETVSEVQAVNDVDITIAYEPVAAIGSGTPATKDDIEKTVKQILQFRSKPTTILYGGSVSPENALDLLSVPGIGGFLVGTASLQAQSFLEIYYAIRQSR